KSKKDVVDRCLVGHKLLSTGADELSSHERTGASTSFRGGNPPGGPTGHRGEGDRRPGESLAPIRFKNRWGELKYCASPDRPHWPTCGDASHRGRPVG